MRSILGAAVLFSLAACQTPSPAASAPAPAETASASATPEKFGIVMPTSFTAIALWPEQYSGQFTVLDVLPHGTSVKQGDVIGHLDTRAIDDEIHREELETRSSEIRHQGVVERNKLEAEAAKSALDQANSALDRARRSLEGYKTRELEFQKRSEELEVRYEQANVEDQTDELDQLEKMYNADTLIDATEDIVLKRSRRQLDTTKVANQLSRDRNVYTNEYEIKLTLEQREEAVRVQADNVARLVRQQEIDARARADAEARSADSLREQRAKLEKLKRDRLLFEIKAPSAGVLLHGGAKDYRPKGTAQRVERGGTLATRSDVLLVADAEGRAIALDVADADLSRAREGARAKAVSLANPSASGDGVLHVEPYPRSTSATESSFEATLMLDAPLAGAVYGTRARVTFDDAKQAQP